MRQTVSVGPLTGPVPETTMRKASVAVVLGCAALIPAVIPTFAVAQQGDTGRAAFRAIYQELVEIDSSPTTGSCIFQ